MSQTQLSAENVEAEISRLISLLKDVRDGMNADTGSASESFRAMRDAMNQFSEVLNSRFQEWALYDVQWKALFYRMVPAR